MEPVLEYEQQMAVIINNYKENLRKNFVLLQKHHEMLKNFLNYSQEEIFIYTKEVHSYIHKLSGSSTMLGFGELGKYAQELDLMLKNSLNESGFYSENPLFLDKFVCLIAEIERILNSSASK